MYVYNESRQSLYIDSVMRTVVSLRSMQRRLYRATCAKLPTTSTRLVAILVAIGFVEMGKLV